MKQSLNSLRAFEAAARLQSFSAAAEELHVTPAAIGQQVRNLEANLNVRLFERVSSGFNRVLPTEAALSALPHIQEGFRSIEAGVEKLAKHTNLNNISIAVSPAFATKWLLPRIEKFKDDHPDVVIHLNANQQAIDYLAERIDIGIRYGHGVWNGLIAEHLTDEEIFPVCSPKLLSMNDSGDLRGFLEKSTLLHDNSMESKSGYPCWERWFRLEYGASLNINSGIKINNPVAVLQSAIDGLGVALARSVLTIGDIITGKLVRPFGNKRLNISLGYYLVYRNDVALSTHVQAFRNWLLCEIEHTKTQLDGIWSPAF